ncbi:MAG: hypothetical protein A2Y92_04455 [Chloroflexi bacterium RBG_13_57_8]|nr:MAG: hypothetical protein A2Y92_04455 [Chloroflexi bacterium RBG_13_57_8]
MHTDLLPTRLRGYVQVSGGVDVAPIHYLGPLVVAQENRPVRVKFTNKLPTGAGGDLFIPVDMTTMGAGLAPNGTENFTQNRATVHLHGNNTVWISDGTPHQWITPAGETTNYPKGVAVWNVPDMPDPGDGSMTLFYTNAQSARLMFYHDHAFGITRLNVYAGEAAGYLIQDTTERALVNARIVPATQIPLIIQDKTFVPPVTQLAAQDPTWDLAKWGSEGNLWFPHVYMPNQNPWDPGGMNTFGRWHYAAWFWPPATNLTYPPVPNPYYDPVNAPWEPPMMPATPNPSAPAEAFMDTPMVNGTAYPYLTLQPQAYRFRILNASNDRFVNLQLYEASSIVSGINITDPGLGYVTPPAVTITPAPGDTTGRGATAAATLDPATGAITAITLSTVGSSYTLPPVVTIAPPPVGGVQATATATIYNNPVNQSEVGMVPAVPTSGFPEAWPTDGRDGGVPDPALAGPSFIQIGNEGGFLPAVAELPNLPVNWNLDQTNFDMGLVNQGTLIVGSAERADVIIDFSAYAGKTLILYNDAPAPFPAIDARYDYHTLGPDLTDIGGTPPTLPGYGPNTRTIMQIRVASAAPARPYNLNAVKAVLPVAYRISQDTTIVPQSAYNAAYRGNFPDNFSRIFDNSLTFQPIGAVADVTIPFLPKAIQDEMGETFDTEYGRMMASLGLELQLTNAGAQNFLLYPYESPPVDIVRNTIAGTQIGALGDGTQIWKITHNGVDTHTVHFHLFNVQLINRVAWDNAIRMPDPNELGWKETVRVNPLQDTIVALRPIIDLNDIPFQVPSSVRLIAPNKPEGEVLMGGPLGFQDPIGEPVQVVNHLVNFAWEYVYHCHLLAHEEMDMMHSVVFIAQDLPPPGAPADMAANWDGVQLQMNLSWTDASTDESHWVIQRTTDPATVPWTDIDVVASATGPGQGTTINYVDTTALQATDYYYRVLASNIIGDATFYPAPSVGFPNARFDSDPSNVAGPVIWP